MKTPPETGRVYAGDCLKTIKSWPDNFVDAVVTDPPYELGFIGKSWDSTGIAYSVPMWSEVFRVMKPGAHLLAFSATRTYHRMACAIEDAGFEIRDQIQWIYGSGFPKSLDIAKAIDKKAGYWRGRAGKVVIESQVAKGTEYERGEKGESITATAWDGWGTALKPANEPIVLARKPISEDTIAENVMRWGTGAINVDAGRIGEEIVGWGGGGGGKNSWKENNFKSDGEPRPVVGRWPANVIFDKYAAGFLDGQAKDAPSRFFYVAKPDTGERDAGLEESETVTAAEVTGRKPGSAGLRSPRDCKTGDSANFHPTVKPVDLMAYLISMVVKPGGVVLDPFTGSGTTGIAAARLSVRFLGCEMNPEYITLAEKRIQAEASQGKMF